MNPFPRQLIRPDLRDFTGYSSARTSFEGPAARIWLNANEAAQPNEADPAGRVRRYPEPQPDALRETLAVYLDTAPDRLLLARGSDEAIDVLVRGLCSPGGSNGVVICSPTFGMYAVAAALHGVPVSDVPQIDTGSGFVHDLALVADTATRDEARIVFLASPGNPTGATIDPAAIATLADSLATQAVVVLDEAYAEFVTAVAQGTSGQSAISLIDEHPNVVVLRTMSKAHALAGARVGAMVAHPDLIAVLRRVQAPYPMPAPVVDLALAALTSQALAHTRRRVVQTVRLRPQLRDVLRSHPGVREVYEGDGNFVLVRCLPGGADTVLADAAGSGIAVRDMRHLRGLDDAVRVTVGTAEEIDSLSMAIGAAAPQTAAPHAVPAPDPTTTPRIPAHHLGGNP